MILMEKMKQTIKKKIVSTDLAVLSILLLVVTIIPLLFTLGLPIPVSTNVQAVYKKIESLPPGSYVLYGSDCAPSGWGEDYPVARAIMQHLFMRPVKIVIIAFDTPAGPQLAESVVQEVNKGTKQYGTDYVNLGYFPGAEVAKAAFAKDVHRLVSQDFYGTSIDKLPIMQNLRTAKDIAYLITVTFMFTGTEEYIRQFVTGYGVTVTQADGAGGLPTATPYIRSGQLLGGVFGFQGAAEYELLLKSPGPAVRQTDALSLTALLMIGFIAAGNFQYFRRKLVDRKGGVK
jgi:hypothetical protein